MLILLRDVPEGVGWFRQAQFCNSLFGSNQFCITYFEYTFSSVVSNFGVNFTLNVKRLNL